MPVPLLLQAALLVKLLFLLSALPMLLLLVPLPQLPQSHHYSTPLLRPLAFCHMI